MVAHLGDNAPALLATEIAGQVGGIKMQMAGGSHMLPQFQNEITKPELLVQTLRDIICSEMETTRKSTHTNTAPFSSSRRVVDEVTLINARGI